MKRCTKTHQQRERQRWRRRRKGWWSNERVWESWTSNNSQLGVSRMNRILFGDRNVPVIGNHRLIVEHKIYNWNVNCIQGSHTQFFVGFNINCGFIDISGLSCSSYFLIGKLSYTPCSEPSHTVLLLHVMYTTIPTTGVNQFTPLGHSISFIPPYLQYY